MKSKSLLLWSLSGLLLLLSVALLYGGKGDPIAVVQQPGDYSLQLTQDPLLEDVAPLSNERREQPPDVGLALAGGVERSKAEPPETLLPGGWLRLAERPDNEPYLPEFKKRCKAELREELSKLTFKELGEEFEMRYYKATQAWDLELQRERKRGHYDILSTEGLQGRWGEEILPSYYEGSFWRSWDLRNGTAEVVRLSPATYSAMYRETYAIEVMRELRAANHNRTWETQQEYALKKVNRYRDAGHEPSDVLLRAAGLID